MAAPSQQFLATHPIFAQLYATGEQSMWEGFLNRHPEIAAEYKRDQSRTTAGPAPAPAPAPAPSSPAAATPGYDQNAYTYLSNLYAGYGLASLAPVILQYAQQGYDSDTTELLLRQTPEFKQRFAANEIRQKQGLNALSISDYLNLENEYSSILSGSGLPQGFYDSKDDFTNWIAADVSPDEVRSRVAIAQNVVLSSDPTVRQQLSTYYGLGDGDLTAYILDQKRATPLITLQRQVNAAGIGAAAANQGLTESRTRAELFSDQGVTADAAKTAFANVAQVLPRGSQLGSIYGTNYDQTTAEDEFLGGLASAQRARQNLTDLEENNFAGQAGVTQTTLRRKTKGQY